jgi:hypothetical protein
MGVRRLRIGSRPRSERRAEHCPSRVRDAWSEGTRKPRPLGRGGITADPSPVADQAHGPEEIPLDHEAIEVPDPLLRVDPVQDEVMLDWRAELVRH